MDLQSNRQFIYNAILNNHLAVATAMHARNMLESIEKFPRNTNRVYRCIDLDNGTIMKFSNTKLNEQFSDDYQAILEGEFLQLGPLHTRAKVLQKLYRTVGRIY